MSFLNPVNEPVLRFKSTDAGAPQINYNARAAGDVKAVLKACLVTGYGTTASAGWSAVNEAGNVIEFVSPSAAMSDYRLGIDDSLTTKTDWYYQYQDAPTRPTGSSPSKSISYVNKSSPDNGWQLLVTERGICFIESFYHTNGKSTVSRITWFGMLKSGLLESGGINIALFSVGFSAPISGRNLLSTNSLGDRHYRIGGVSDVRLDSSNSIALTANPKVKNISVMDSASTIFIRTINYVVGVQPALLIVDINNTEDTLGIRDVVINDRPAVRFSVADANTSKVDIESYGGNMAVYLDYWGF